MGVPFIEKPDGKLTADSGELPALLDDDNESEDGDEFDDIDEDDEIDEDDDESDEDDDESDGEDDIRQHGELGYAYSTDETEEEWDDPSENGVLSRVLDASERGDETELQVLLPELNVSVNTINSDGDTALHLAALYGHTGCARLLLGAGARADIRDENEGVPLHDAAAGGYQDLVLILLDSAPHCISVRDIDGDTPLHNAARGGFADIINFLLERGADPGAQNNEGMTPLDLTVAGSAARNALMNR